MNQFQISLPVQRIARKLLSPWWTYLKEIIVDLSIRFGTLHVPQPTIQVRIGAVAILRITDTLKNSK